MRARGKFAFTCVLALVTLRSLPAQGPKVYPPGSTVDGLTLAEWSEKWWEWAYGPPVCQFNDRTGETHCLGQSGPVFFISGTTRNNPITPEDPRRFTVPTGKKIFFPLANFLGYALAPEEIPVLKADCDVILDLSNIDELKCTVDGVEIAGLEDHKEVTPPFDLLFREGNCRNEPPGPSPSLACGFWIMLEPLSEGDHSISFRAVLKEPAIVQEVYYVLTVSASGLFHRGDTDGSATINIADPVALLNRLFQGGAPPSCDDAADSNDDGKLDVSDAVFTLNYLFAGGEKPALSGPEDCCSDPTPDDLTSCAARC